MFGYVRPALSLLSEEDRDAYQGAYCGLCHAMGARHGFWSRFTLNYDFAFLAILFSGEDQGGWACRRCPAHPARRPRRCLCSPGLDAAADASLLLTWYKLRDDVQDNGLFKGLPARSLSRFFDRAAKRARGAAPAFAAETERSLALLRELEGQNSSQLDRASGAFARVLQAAAPRTQDVARRRAMEQLLYHLGRWIYLVDAWDDLLEDRRRGRYNPLDARFEGRAEEQRDYISTTMTHSLRLAVSSANLLELGRWRPIVENMLYRGLPAVQEAVLDRRWRGPKSQKRPYKESDE